MSNTDVRAFLYPKRAIESGRKMPDCSYLHKELAKPGVTLTLLRSGYCEQCYSEQLIPYQCTQFCEYYRTYASRTKATMCIKRKPGELLEVDWAGTPYLSLVRCLVRFSQSMFLLLLFLVAFMAMQRSSHLW